MMERTGPAAGVAGQRSDAESKLLRGLVDYLRQKRPELRQEWASRITDAQLLRVMRADEIFSEVTAVYDNYVNALETGSVEALRAYARDLSERIVPRGVETDEVLGTVLLLRDVLARALFVRHQGDPGLLGRVLDVSEPASWRTPRSRSTPPGRSRRSFSSWPNTPASSSPRSAAVWSSGSPMASRSTPTPTPSREPNRSPCRRRTWRHCTPPWRPAAGRCA